MSPAHLSPFALFLVLEKSGFRRIADGKMSRGLYIPDSPAYPSHFRGMGIRIEDSVCVQEEYPFVLTTEAVKEVDDIEALRG